MKKRLLWLLTLLEGVIALALLLLPPSESSSARFLGYSLARLALAGTFLLLLVVLAVSVLFILRRPDWWQKRLEALDARLVAGGSLLPLSFWLGVILVGGVTAPLLYRPLADFLFQHTYTFFVYDYALQAAHLFGTIEMVFLRALPLAAWLWLQTLQVSLWLVRRYAHLYRRRSFYRVPVIGRCALLLLVVLGAVFQWLMLYLHLDFLQYLDGWFWKFYDKPIEHPWWFLVLLPLSLFALWLVRRFPRQRALCLTFLFLLGCGLQWGFGYMEGRGGLERIYAERGRLAYPARICRGVHLRDILLDYEQVHEGDMYFNTKPPGTLLVYSLVQKLAALLMPGEDCYTSMLRLIPWLFLPLAFVGLPLLERMARALLGDDSLLAPLMLLFFPNYLLIPLELDGTLLPLFTLLAACCMWRALEERRTGWALAAGALVHLGVYLSFALLPLLVFCLGWISADLMWRLWQPGETTSGATGIRSAWRGSLRLAAGFCAGFLCLLLLFLLVFHYDPLQRYLAAMEAHRVAKEYTTGLAQLGDALLLNNAEFLTWIGLPCSLLLLGGLVRSGRAWLRRCASPSDVLMLVVLGVYIALNLVGQTRGEVARLWLFLLPLLAPFTAREAACLLPRKGAALAFMIILQMVTTFLLFAFQDLG